MNLREAYDWQKKMVVGSNLKSSVDKSRLFLLKVMFLCVLVVMAVRLVKLQVVEGAVYRQRSDNNRIYERRVVAPRGVIKDRNGQALVVNQPVYKLLANDRGKLLSELTPISREEALKLDASGSNGVVYDIGRYYPQGAVFAHLVGYVGLADESDVASGDYVLDDWVGREGVEKQYQDSLAGVVGSELIEVNASGEVIRRVGEVSPKSGANLIVYADAGLQQVLFDQMAGRPGVAVATDPRTGEVLALVSTPAFDPNLFSSQRPEDKRAKAEKLPTILTDEAKPLLNRAVSGAYPPGSIFKVVPAVGGLETKTVTKATTVEDTGEIKVDEYSYKNWYFTQYGGTEGLVDIVKALKRSNDIYFYKLGEWLGPTELAHWAGEFGLGNVTGVDLPGEVSGLVPTPVWKEKTKGERWFLGNTYHFAIGQGDLLATPLQLNQMMGVIASGGRWCKPKVVKSVGSDEVGENVSCRQLSISEETLSRVRQGLVQACEVGGTGLPFFDFDLGRFGGQYSGERSRVACKTGTAQFFDLEDKTHAWFSVFAPAVEPEIQLTVLLEGAGEGSVEAAPVARAALEYWFGGKVGE